MHVGQGLCRNATSPAPQCRSLSSDVLQSIEQSEVLAPLGGSIFKLKQQGFWAPVDLAGKVCIS